MGGEEGQSGPGNTFFPSLEVANIVHVDDDD